MAPKGVSHCKTWNNAYTDLCIHRTHTNSNFVTMTVVCRLKIEPAIDLRTMIPSLLHPSCTRKALAITATL